MHIGLLPARRIIYRNITETCYTSAISFSADFYVKCLSCLFNGYYLLVSQTVNVPKSRAFFVQNIGVNYA